MLFLIIISDNRVKNSILFSDIFFFLSQIKLQCISISLSNIIIIICVCKNHFLIIKIRKSKFYYHIALIPTVSLILIKTALMIILISILN
jgi:hypothetical protein